MTYKSKLHAAKLAFRAVCPEAEKSDIDLIVDMIFEAAIDCSQEGVDHKLGMIENSMRGYVDMEIKAVVGAYDGGKS